MIKIAVTSVFVNDQGKALNFYTDILGFQKRMDIPLGTGRWLTVASAGASDGIELLLEPNDNPIARTYQRALFEAGQPATTFATDDVRAEYDRMILLGVRFTTTPRTIGPVTQAVFDDTCGNLIMLTQLG